MSLDNSLCNDMEYTIENKSKNILKLDQQAKDCGQFGKQREDVPLLTPLCKINQQIWWNSKI